ncbi:MAG: FHA domain-containing protein [SAR86 cluster bacterium]|uniref:FHA domain-containing protein n=1 Tax=SAR86 cluster bacterium TaxID=2030880 RepID=A0A2A5CBI0_9GAMM|nr:MAG: FHA domain-containing protein [SAR86 cluster bacterium]
MKKQEIVGFMLNEKTKKIGFISELKRRKVLQTCAFYIFGCWFFLQIGDILFPVISSDENKIFLYLLYGMAGFFPAVILMSWFYQISTSGIERTHAFIERRMTSNIPPINDRRRNPEKTTNNEDYIWTITAQSGPLKGLSYGVSGPLVIGRSLDCDLTIISPQISRKHAQLTLNNDLLSVEDLGSANGTMINGESVEGVQLLHNEDKLQFQEIMFQINRNYNKERNSNTAENATVLFSRNESD